jgi:hypothetical protein
MNEHRYRRQPDLREALRHLQDRIAPTHFVTLATNDPMVSSQRMRGLLREWDARVNRELIGPRWHRRPDERMVWIASPEKLGAAPHWHLVVQILDTQVATFEHNNILERHWQRLILSGSVHFDRIRDGGAGRYATKDVDLPDNWEMFVSSLEFIRQ